MLKFSDHPAHVETRSPRLIRSRSIAATCAPRPKRKLEGVASLCDPSCRSCHYTDGHATCPVARGTLPRQIPDPRAFQQCCDDRVKIVTFSPEINTVIIRRPVVLSREEISKRFEVPVRVRTVAMMRGPPDRLCQLLARGLASVRDNPAVSPVLSANPRSSTSPACDTTPSPPAVTSSPFDQPVTFALRVLLTWTQAEAGGPGLLGIGTADGHHRNMVGIPVCVDRCADAPDWAK